MIRCSLVPAEMDRKEGKDVKDSQDRPTQTKTRKKRLTKKEIIDKAMNIYPYYFARMGFSGIPESQIRIKTYKSLKFIYHAVYRKGDFVHYSGIVVDLGQMAGSPFIVTRDEIEQMMFGSITARLLCGGYDFKLRPRGYWNR